MFQLKLAQLALSTISKNEKQCIYIDQSSFQNCAGKPRAQEADTLRKLLNVNKRWGGSLPDDNCTLPSPCRRLYQTARIKRTMSQAIAIQVAKMLQQCCGGCSRYNETELTERSREGNEAYLSDEFDMVYPIYNSRSLIGSLGFFFVPVYKPAAAYYITLKKTEKKMAESVIMSCLEMWPLLVIGALMSVIAGFFVWLFETWSNVEQFPRSIGSGIWQGFWWAFVSMTTVGYGDKIPKSPLARIFTFVWLLVGMTICSIYVASIATNVMDMKNPTTPDLKGRKVGALAGRPHDLLTISQEGGVARQMEFNDTTVGYINLVKMLKSGDIDGILMNRMTYYYCNKRLRDHERYRKFMPSAHLATTEKELIGEDIVGGMLLRRWDDYQFFRRYFEINWAHLQGCYTFDANHRQIEYREDDENVLEGLFFPFLHGTLIVLVIIVVFGVVYEVHRRMAGRNVNQLPCDGNKE